MIKKFLDKWIYLLPIILLGVDVICLFCEYNFIVLGNAVGYSLLTNVALFYLFFYRTKYCWLTRLSPIALCAINVVNMIGPYIDDAHYHVIYISSIILSVFFLSIILQLKKLNHHGRYSRDR
jgi:hypothetical protein